MIEQTGTHARIAFGEVFGDRSAVSARVAAIGGAFESAGIEVNTHADARAPLWEKFIYLAPFAGMTGAARRPIGPLRARADTIALLDRACGEVEAVARAEGVAVAADVRARIRHYIDVLPPSTRSSLLIDLQAGKRIEVEALQGSVVRRARAAGIDVPVMETLYAVLREYGELPAATRNAEREVRN
jgi:2-dehydropantoate 2-reductase